MAVLLWCALLAQSAEDSLVHTLVSAIISEPSTSSQVEASHCKSQGIAQERLQE